MGCEQTQDVLLDGLVAGEDAPPAGPLADHLAGCARCRSEWEASRQTWADLRQLPEVVPGARVRAQLLRQVRQAMLREWLLTIGGWLPAGLAAALGVALSLGLALLMPYDSLVSACQTVLQLGEADPAPYWLAGVAYGVPLAVGAWVLRRRAAAGGVIGSLEASLLFVAILTPVVLVSCRDFAPPLRAAFVSGLGAGAVAASLVGFAVARLRHLSRAES